MPIEADIYYHFYEGSAVGERPALILIHGAGGNHLYWPPNIRRLGGYRVFAPDLPGHGKSGGRGQQTISAYADSIRDWMDTIGLHSAILVGHSMGSAIALDLALNHRQHVTALTLLGAGARMRVNPTLIEAASSQTTFHIAIDNIIDWSFATDTPQELKDLAAKRMMEIRPSVLHGDFLACDTFDVSEQLGEINKPTLIICGKEDQMTPPRNSQFLEDQIPDASLAVLPNAGHMLMLEQPGQAADVLLDFIDNIHY